MKANGNELNIDKPLDQMSIDDDYEDENDVSIVIEEEKQMKKTSSIQTGSSSQRATLLKGSNKVSEHHLGKNLRLKSPEAGPT